MKFRTGLLLALCAVVSFGFWAVTSRLTVAIQPSFSLEILAPLVATYFIWTERSTIFSRSEYSSRRAAQIGAPAVVVLSIGLVLMHSHPMLAFFVSAASAGALIAAGFVGIYGEESLRRAAFPLALLAVMLPLPRALVDGVIYGLQVGSTYLSEQIFSAVGIPVLRSGFVLSVPGVSIEIAKECSGINSTLALLLTMVVVARQTLHTLWRRVALLLVMLPLSIVKNAIRIVTLTLLAVKVNPSFLTGRLHHQGGFVFYLVTLALIFPIISLLRKGERSNTRQLVAAARGATLAG